MNRSMLSFLLLTCPLLACADDIPPIPVPEWTTGGDTTGVVPPNPTTVTDTMATSATDDATSDSGSSTVADSGSSSVTAAQTDSTSSSSSSSSGEPVCGDGSQDPGEDCDAADLGGSTCETLGQGFAGGTLSCDAACTFDTSGCTSCGNDAVDPGEGCDGTDLGGQACSDLGFFGGTLGCDAACTLDTVACTNNLYFSEYVEGSSNNKALEIFNASAVAANLDACEIRFYFNGGVAPSNTLGLTGSLASDDAWVICDDNIADMSFCDELGAGPFFNGDDAIELACNGTTLDVIGQIGLDPGLEWVAGGVSTVDQTLRRACAVTVGDTNGANAFDPSLEWVSFPQNTYTDLGQHVCP